MAVSSDEVPVDFNVDPNVKRQDFPAEFIFGVGSSAYQVEGAWQEDGKGMQTWDCFTMRNPGRIFDGSNGCVSIDSYHRMKEDVQLLKKMGVKNYRFSLSWSRILPGGKVSMGKNMKGIDYYNRLIDELKANDIEPFVTLFHFDLPNALEEEYMGCLSSKLVDDFVNYAELCFWEFGDRVKNWVTINEPYGVVYAGYVVGMGAPGRGGTGQEGDPATEPYTVAYNLLNCHAAAYRKYQEDFKDVQKGRVGITLGTNFFKPANKGNPDDMKAVEYALDFAFGLFFEPIVSGNWPASVQNFAVLPSVNHPQGRTLPQFTEDQKKKLIQSIDFLGVNYYNSLYAKAKTLTAPSAGFSDDNHAELSGQDPSGKDIGERPFPTSRIYLCPLELADLMVYIKNTYKFDKCIIITENGSPEQRNDKIPYDKVKDDVYRQKYIKWHIEALRRVNNVLKLTAESGTKPFVMGYFVWSFTDSFELNSGYTTRFGMNYVDYNNNLLRYPKKISNLVQKVSFRRQIIIVGKPQKNSSRH